MFQQMFHRRDVSFHARSETRTGQIQRKVQHKFVMQNLFSPHFLSDEHSDLSRDPLRRPEL